MAIIIEGDLKVPFSKATTPSCRGGRFFFLWIVLFTLDPYFTMMTIKQGGVKYHFWVFGMTWLGIEPQSSGPLENTLLIRPMGCENELLFRRNTWDSITECKLFVSNFSNKKQQTWLKKQFIVNEEQIK